MNRPLCPVCAQRFCSINYHKNQVIHYRAKCQICINKNKQIPTPKPRWLTANYKKKLTCDRCNFRSKFASQLLVFHVDGNLHNSTLRNLKTVCLNCVEEIKKSNLPWRAGDLEPDL